MRTFPKAIGGVTSLGVLAAMLTMAMLTAPVAWAAGFADWSNDGAFQRDNSLRGEIVLNGTWRWQPYEEGKDRPDEKAWLFRNVPGWDARDFFIRDANGKIVKKIKGKRISGKERCWQERTFTLPRDWAGRKVVLEFYATRGNTSLFLDGEKLSDIKLSKGKGRFKPWTAWEVTLPTPLKLDAPYRLTIATDGIFDDVWLRSYPASGGGKIMAAGPIQDDHLITSVRKKHLQLKTDGLSRAARKVRLVVAEESKSLKTWTAGIAPDESGQWKLDKSFAWADAKLWSPEHPNLYWYKIELLDGDDKVIDATLGKRFGFREFWIEGGSFYLNGKPITMRSHQSPSFKFDVTSNNRVAAKTRRFVRENVTCWKSVGMNMCMMWGFGETNGQVVFDTLDELGFLTITSARDYKYYADPKEHPDRKAAWIARTTRIYKRYRHHPSFIAFSSGGGHQIWDACPATIDGSRDPEKDWPDQLKAPVESFKRRAALHKSLDPTRPVMWHSSVARSSPIVGTMGYLSFDLDLQERENWPLAWSRTRHKPLFNMEFGMPFSMSWALRPKFNRPTKVRFALEYSAMYFGDEFYRSARPEWMGYFAGKGKAPKRTGHSYSPPEDAVRSLFTRQTFQAWRTYGVNLGPFGEQYAWFDMNSAKYYKHRGEDPRRIGSTPDRWAGHKSSWSGKLTQIGQAAKETLTPLYAYIGGAEHFTRKDHCYFSGQDVAKHVIVINDREDPVEVRGVWGLYDDKGEQVLKGDLGKVKIASGLRSLNDLNIRFKAPQVDQRTDYTLKAICAANLQGRLTDTMTITIFPPKPVAWSSLTIPSRIYCFDPAGEAQKMLTKAGAGFESISDGKSLTDTSRLLVIGRHALENAYNVKKLGAAFDKAVDAGLRVLVLEQATGNVLGLEMEETSPRHVFIRAKGHPAFAGLADGDFRYWRGESDLFKAYADALDPWDGKVPPRRSTYPKRFWHWGNDNSVSTFVIKKPQLGAARALLDCGFDLLETPLLETVRGRGRIIFCQLDVSNRYGTDPVATRVMDNLLRYLTTSKPPETNLGEPIDLVQKPEDSVKLTEFTGFCAAPPAGGLGWGISAADMFFRDELTLKAIKTDAAPPTMFIKIGDKRIGYTLRAESLKTGWQKMKAMIVLSALRINQGGTSATGPRTSLNGDAKALYPVEWLEGFVHPYRHCRW